MIRIGKLALAVAVVVLVCAAPAVAAPQTFTVINKNPSGPGSLAAAITSANGNGNIGEVDTINFSIDGGGPARTIDQNVPLPAITQGVIIDGRTQNVPGNPTPITLTGTGNAAGTAGLTFNGGPGHSQVTGLVFAGWPGPAIDIPAGPSTLVAADLILSSGTGVRVSGVSSGTVITGSGIGTTGAVAVGNTGAGVVLDGVTGVTVGAVAGPPFLGTDPRNVISGNGGDGLLVQNLAGDNTIAGNLIGTANNGTTALPNGGAGVHVANAHGPTRIKAAEVNGTPFPNLIAGNTGDGVLVDHAGTATIIDGNQIGTDQAPKNGGNGVELNGAVAAKVTNNTIDNNTAVGVRIAGPLATQNLVTGNLIGLSDNDSGAGNGDEGVRIRDGAFNNTIGGPGATDGNTVSNNTGIGINVQGGGGTPPGNLVQGNTVGTDVAGNLARGNGNDGLKVDNTDNTRFLGNLSSGNAGSGIGTESVSGAVVQGNTVGLNRAMTSPLPNDRGVRVESQNTRIGGPGAGQGNTIAGNTGAGVLLNNDNALLQGNTIGRGAAGKPIPNGGDGVFINDVGAIVGGLGGAANTIASNNGAGVHVTAGNNATVAENAIFDNGALGIDVDPLGVTAAGAPVLASAVVGNGPPTVTGTLASTPNTSLTLRFSASPSCDPSGFGEGQTPLGSLNVQTDGAGRASFTTAALSLGLSDVLTATATNNATGATSEFSACRSVSAFVAPVTTTAPTPTTTTVIPPTAVAPPPGDAPPVPPVCKLSDRGNTAGIFVTATCDRAVTVSVSGRATITTKRKRRRAKLAATKRVALATRTVSIGAGKSGTVKLSIPRAAVSAVKRHRKVSVKLEATARTADGAEDQQFATIARLRAAPKRKGKR